MSVSQPRAPGLAEGLDKMRSKPRWGLRKDGRPAPRPARARVADIGTTR